MLKSIRIQNFQKHKKVIIELDPRITTIVGPSDSGKSSIVRAISYLAFNSPSGMAFIRDGAKGCTVALITDEHTVKRRRSKSVNSYEVDGNELKALRRGDVPDDVINALRLDSLNFQLQHDPPFWLSESGGQVSKKLNEIVDLDIIDTTLTTLNKQLRDVSSEVTVSQSRLSKAKSDQDELSWVKGASNEYDKVEQLSSELQTTQIKHTQLLAVVSSLRKAEQKIIAIEDVLGPVKQDYRNMKLLSSELQDTQNKYTELEELVKSLGRAQQTISDIEDVLEPVKQDYEDVLGSYERLEEVRSEIIELEELLDELNSHDSRLVDMDAKLNILQGRLGEVDMCPLCGKQMK